MRWQAIGASICGTSHKRIGMPCQDAHLIKQGTNYCLAAVADGLGSARYSDIASQRAVLTALESIEAVLNTEILIDPEAWQTLIRHAFASAREALVGFAATDGEPLREYGTTLIVVAITPDWFVVGQLGDGAVAVLTNSGCMGLVCTPQRGEYANETIPLTSPQALSYLIVEAHRIKLAAIALLTDGLQQLAINGPGNIPHIPFFVPFFEAIQKPLDEKTTSQQLRDFLDSERVCRRTDDDKTLVILGRLMPEHEGLQAWSAIDPTSTCD